LAEVPQITGGDEGPGPFRLWLTDRLGRLERLGRGAGRNWQVIFAGLVAASAIWMWILEPEKEISSGRWSPEEYVEHAEMRMRQARKLPLPLRARLRARHLVEARDGLENLETIHGIEDTPDLWRAAEYLAQIRRELALLRREYPGEVAKIIEQEARDLLAQSVAGYGEALGMESPADEDRRRMKAGRADALSDLGQHSDVVAELSPIVRELRRDDVARLLRMKDENEIPVVEEGAGVLDSFETHVHMTLARSLRELGRSDDARRHYAVAEALSGAAPDKAGLAKAARYYRQVRSGGSNEDRRFEAGMRLGGTLLAAGEARAAGEAFADAAKGRDEDDGSRLAELMQGISLVRHAAGPVTEAERDVALKSATEVLESIGRKSPVGPRAAAARVVLGDVLLVKKDLDGAWRTYSGMGTSRLGAAAGTRSGILAGLPGLGNVLRPGSMVERLMKLAAEYSAAGDHEAAIEALAMALERWSADPGLVRPKIAAESDLRAAELERWAASAEAGPERNLELSKRRTWVMRAAREYLAIATKSPRSEVQARALLIAAERFKSAGSNLKAAGAYRLFAASFSDAPAASRALHELGGCLQKIGRHRGAALAFRENIRRHPKEPYGYLSHFEWGQSLFMWGKLSGDARRPVEPEGGRPLGGPALVLGARQVFEGILGRSEVAGELYRKAVSVLTEALERYPLKKYDAQKKIQPAFYEFLWDEEMLTTEALAMSHVGLAQHREALRYLAGLTGQIILRQRLSEGPEEEGLSAREKSFFLYTGLCHYKLGLAEEDEKVARGHFLTALERFTEARDKLLQEPESPWVRHGMALCYERLGDLDAAARAYRDATWAYQNVPEEPLAPEGLGRDFWLERNRMLREALEWKVKARGEKRMM